MYSVHEYDGTINPVLVLNNSLSFDVTVTVRNDDNIANGK